MAHLNTEGIARIGKFIRKMLEEDGDRTNENREHLTCRRKRNRKCNTRGNILMSDDDEDGRNHGRKSCIRSHCCTNVHPSECHEFERSTENDAGGDIAEHKSDERAGNQRTVKLCLIEHTCHACERRNGDEQDKLYCIHIRYLLCPILAKQAPLP